MNEDDFRCDSHSYRSSRPTATCPICARIAAQVATLVKALREIAQENYSWSVDAVIARDALKAAGVET